jgi:hypothetical protein
MELQTPSFSATSPYRARGGDFFVRLGAPGGRVRGEYGPGLQDQVESEHWPILPSRG